ncbi:hypothetical protein [Thiocapsa bogorovii]|uniref:hypothetical protein n=1 Tax=Thiocapsa bogorovii TaxID=521689 RepID=UPI001E29AECF|nr:hypothetical protein [Thiocapsa bogorovii]UHD14939.1 hypothetical protein LT988_16855 [Thiocapsa bogorovii]
MNANRTMKLSTLAAAVGFLVTGAAYALDANQAEQTVGYEVEGYGVISVSANVTGLTISAPLVPGDAPADATDTGKTYSYSTNKTDQVITAQLNEIMETGLALKLTLGTPTGDDAAGTSGGEQTLDNVTAKTLVTGVAGNGSGSIAYTLSATTAAAVGATLSKTVTFTITDA